MALATGYDWEMLANANISPYPDWMGKIEVSNFSKNESLWSL